MVRNETLGTFWPVSLQRLVDIFRCVVFLFSFCSHSWYFRSYSSPIDGNYVFPNVYVCKFINGIIIWHYSLLQHCGPVDILHLSFFSTVVEWQQNFYGFPANCRKVYSIWMHILLQLYCCSSHLFPGLQLQLGLWILLQWHIQPHQLVSQDRKMVCTAIYLNTITVMT